MSLPFALRRLRRRQEGYCVCGGKTNRLIQAGGRYRYGHRECEAAVVADEEKRRFRGRDRQP